MPEIHWLSRSTRPHTDDYMYSRQCAVILATVMSFLIWPVSIRWDAIIRIQMLVHFYGDASDILVAKKNSCSQRERLSSLYRYGYGQSASHLSPLTLQYANDSEGHLILLFAFNYFINYMILVELSIKWHSHIATSLSIFIERHRLTWYFSLLSALYVNKYHH